MCGVLHKEEIIAYHPLSALLVQFRSQNLNQNHVNFMKASIVLSHVCLSLPSVTQCVERVWGSHPQAHPTSHSTISLLKTEHKR